MIALQTLSAHLSSHSLVGKTALLRADLNVPMHQGRISDTTRIDKTIPTIRALQEAGARVIVTSHFGRPEGKGYEADLSLAPIADALSQQMNGEPVKFAVDCVGPAASKAVDQLPERGVLLMENLRFHAEEKKNDPAFCEQLASFADIYVSDAFSCSHRAHASIEGIAKLLPAYAGLLLEEEITQLTKALDTPQRPIVAVVGGSKVSTKIPILERLVQKVDYLLIGGGMANTFIYAQGHDVQKSLYEKKLKKTAKDIIKKADKAGCKLMVPVDGVVAQSLSHQPPCKVVSVDKVPKDYSILDIGPQTLLDWSDIIKGCSTLVWNGPLGAFEYSPFNVGTISLARVVASQSSKSLLNSVAGGGDVLSALSQAGLRDSFSYISTAGGAFMEWLEGKELPGVAVLTR